MVCDEVNVKFVLEWEQGKSWLALENRKKPGTCSIGVPAEKISATLKLQENTLTPSFPSGVRRGKPF